MSRKQLTKDELYESVKAIYDSPHPHIHLPQQKLYTLFSIGFQYFLYKSSKEPGAYIIRVENSHLAEKIARKAKDETSRKFMGRLLHTRKIRYDNSTFYLDYFNFQSWNITSELPKNRIKGALIVKNTGADPMIEESDFRYQVSSIMTLTEETPVINPFTTEFGEHYYLTTLTSVADRTITIAYEQNFENLTAMKFDFIPEPVESSYGVRLSTDIKFEE